MISTIGIDLKTVSTYLFEESIVYLQRKVSINEQES